MSFRPFAPREFSWQLNAPNSQNPIFLQTPDYNALWVTIVDVVDTHFEIARDTPIRLYNSVLTEGRLYTKPKIGASLMEPWHADSVGLNERFDCTLQTIRRRVTLRATPEAGGFLIEVMVYKEIEDLRSPMKSTASVANLRFEDDIDQFASQIDVDMNSAGWVLLGRDHAMEERILHEIVYRLKYPPKVIRSSKEPIRG